MSTAKLSACSPLRMNDAVFFSSSTTRTRIDFWDPSEGQARRKANYALARKRIREHFPKILSRLFHRGTIHVVHRILQQSFQHCEPSQDQRRIVPGQVFGVDGDFSK